jgi:hypothetical protein
VRLGLRLPIVVVSRRHLTGAVVSPRAPRGVRVRLRPLIHGGGVARDWQSRQVRVERVVLLAV